MQSVPEFMECYLREGAELRQACFKLGQSFREKFFARDYLIRPPEQDALLDKFQETISIV